MRRAAGGGSLRRCSSYRKWLTWRQRVPRSRSVTSYTGWDHPRRVMSHRRTSRDARPVMTAAADWSREHRYVAGWSRTVLQLVLCCCWLDCCHRYRRLHQSYTWHSHWQHTSYVSQRLPDPVIHRIGDIRWQTAAEWLEALQRSQWRAYRKLVFCSVMSPFERAMHNIYRMVPSLTSPFPQMGVPNAHQLRDACCRVANMIEDIDNISST